MSDKSKPSHIERVVYVSPDVTPGSSIRYGSWVESRGGYFPFPSYVQLTIIESATGSDYSGNLVEKSNALALKRDFPWLVEIYGGHGTFGVAYLGRRENQNDALIEAIDALTEYPLYDESHHSDLETDTAWEAWTDSYGGRRDFKRALVEMWALDDNEYDEDRLDDDLVDAVWRDCCEMLRGGEEYLNESGDSIYFPIDLVIDDIRRDRTALYHSTWRDDNRPIIEKLEELRASALVAIAGETVNP